LGYLGVKGDKTKAVFIQGRRNIDFLVALTGESARATWTIPRSNITMGLCRGIIAIPRKRYSFGTFRAKGIPIELRRRHVFTNPGQDCRSMLNS
jgi:hypothetical protein